MDKVLFYQKTKRTMINEINKVNKILAPTYGPLGSSVIIAKEKMAPLITDDGYIIAQNIINYNSALYHAIEKMDDKVGDGTTTVALLTGGMIKKAYKSSFLYNKQEIRKGMKQTIENAIKYLSMKKISPSTIDLMNIAKIASKDNEIGYLMGNIFAENGTDVFIKIEETNEDKISFECQKGYCIKKGIKNDFLENSIKIELDKPFVILNNKFNISEEALKSFKRDFVIITPNIDNLTMNNIITNNKKQKNKGYVILLPITSKYDEALYDDIASYINDNGKVDKIIMSNNESIIINNNQETMKRVQFLTNLRDKAPLYEKNLYDERIAYLKSKIVIIKLGGKTELEIKNKKIKIEDAINACYNSIKYGIVSGGGTCYYEISQKIECNLPHLSKSYQRGVAIIKKVLQIPFEVIIKNSGAKIKHIKKRKKRHQDGYGYDTTLKTFVNCFDKGIIDPYYNLYQALQIALSTTLSVFPIHTMIEINNFRESTYECL